MYTILKVKENGIIIIIIIIIMVCVLFPSLLAFVSAYVRTLHTCVKESRNRPGVAQRVPGGLGILIFMILVT
jgi:flagellar basal body-associated protein FliL